jgi:hypothetical protein
MMEKHKLKERVKRGEISAEDALTDLQNRADLDGSWKYVKTTHTYRWLLKRVKESK